MPTESAVKDKRNNDRLLLKKKNIDWIATAVLDFMSEVPWGILYLALPCSFFYYGLRLGAT